MKTRAAILATVVTAGLAGSAAGVAANRASTPLPPSAASTSVGDAPSTAPAPAPPTTPATPSRVPTTTAEPITPTTASAPTSTPAPTPKATPTFSAKPIYSPEWDLSSLLTTTELVKAGLWNDPGSSGRSPGLGQSPLGLCDPLVGTYPGSRAFFTADTNYYDRSVYEAQATARFSTSALARQAVERMVTRRTICDAGSISPSGPWTSSPLRRMTPANASAVTWTMTPTKPARSETIVVVRSGAFVSIVLVAGPPSSLNRIDRASLAASAAARLP